MTFEKSLLTILLTGCLFFLPVDGSDAHSEPLASYFNSIRSNHDSLRNFLRKMPKGGELHVHLSGIPSPERLLELAASDKQYHYFVRIPNGKFRLDDPKAYALVPMKSRNVNDSTLVPVATIEYPQTDLARHQRAEFCRAMTLTASEKNAAEIFCNASFQRRRPLLRTPAVAASVVADYIRQASKDKVIYLEIQVDPCLTDPFANASELERSITFKSMRDNLLALRNSAQIANGLLPAKERVLVRFLISLNRENPVVLKKLPLAFQLASDAGFSDCVAGINICGNEYGYGGKDGWESAHSKALRQTLSKLRLAFPEVKISMHAGESRDPDHHIKDSVTSGAQRIGHGTNFGITDVAFSDDLKVLRQKRILLEICPTSEYVLLGLRYKQNPFLIFSRAGIPVGISSDDPGLFGVDLSEEYARLIEAHPEISLGELEQVCKNSLLHAFVPSNTKNDLLARWDEQMKEFSMMHARKKSRSN